MSISTARMRAFRKGWVFAEGVWGAYHTDHELLHLSAVATQGYFAALKGLRWRADLFRMLPNERAAFIAARWDRRRRRDRRA